MEKVLKSILKTQIEEEQEEEKAGGHHEPHPPEVREAVLEGGQGRIFSLKSRV